MTDIKTIALVGGAVAMPTLLAKLSRTSVGRLIPHYVTDAHKAALAKLTESGITGGDQANHRYLEYNRARIATNGASSTKPHLADLSDEDLHALSEAFLEAAYAGVRIPVGIGSTSRAPYQLVSEQVTRTLIEPSFVETTWNHLEDADGRNLTDFGRAVQRVMKIKRGLQSGFIASPEDMLSGNLAVGFLAIEMDDQGYLITGQPESKTLAGGASAAWDATLAFASDASTDAAKKAALALWELGKSSPMFLGVAAFAAWRIFR